MKPFKMLFAVVTMLLVPVASATAAWEDPKRVDNIGEFDGATLDGDIATGANGLATVFFWQQKSGPNPAASGIASMNRRGAADTDWAGSHAVPPGTGSAQVLTKSVLAAAPDGSALGAHVFTTTVGNVLSLVGWLAPDADPFARTNVNTATGSDALDIDTDAAGNAYVALRTTVANKVGVYIFKYDAATKAWVTTANVVDNETTDDATNPRIDVNDDGDIAISYVKKKAGSNPAGGTRGVIAMKRLLKGATDFSPERIVSQDTGADPASQSTGNIESDPVDEHDIAIDPDGDIMVVFAADPGRPRNPIADGGNVTFNRIYFQRWQNELASPTGGDTAANNSISDKDPDAPSAFDPKLAVSPQGRFTLVWRQHASPPPQPEQAQSSQLLTSEYSGAWSQPPVKLSGDDGVEGDTFTSSQAVDKTKSDPAYDVVVDSSGTATFVWEEGGKLQSKRRAPTKAPDAEAEVISQEGLLAGGFDSDFAPRLSVGGTQVDAFWKQTLLTTDRAQGLAARFTPPAPPVVEPPKVPDESDAVGCPTGNIVMNGTEGDDALTGTEGADSMAGLGGADSLIGLGGDDCIRGGEGNDSNLSGGAGNDDIDGEGGDDTASGGDGNDAMSGGLGNDTLYGQAGIDRLLGGDGDDRMLGADGDDQMLGGAGNDRLFGQIGIDAIGGDAGNDVINSSGGADFVLGGEGDDKIDVGSGNDVAAAGEGNDALRAGSGVDKLFGEGGDDKLFGGAGRDELDGGTGTNRISGQAGNDKLLGGDLIDRLFGGKGKDTLTGGAGDDRLSGGGGKDTLTGGDGKDSISGGKGKDKIVSGAGDDVIGAVDKTRDKIECGSGVDKVKADRKDKVARTCEKVKIAGKRKPKKS